MQSGYDVIVIGGGHNGLVAAAYLARAGRRVLILEKRSVVGGAVTTEETRLGFRFPTASVCGLLRREIIEDLELPRHGLAFVPFDPAVAVLGEDGKALRIWRDVRKAQSEIAARSAADAAAYPRFRSFMMRIASVLDPMFLRIPPSIASPSVGDELFLFRRALRLRRLGKEDMLQALRIPFMSVRDVLGEWFETERLKSSLALDALFGVFRGPWSPYTAFGLIQRHLPEANGGAWAFIRGGGAGLSNALAAAAQEAGVAIRTGAEVRRIVSPDGRVTGVQLVNGETIAARVVVSNADPKRTFLGLVDPVDLGADFLMRVRNYSSDGCVSKVDIALDAAPQLPAAGGSGPPPHFQIAPTLEYIERAYDDAKNGSPSKSPTLDVFVPSAVDPTLAPPGKHVMSVLVQYTPFHLKKGTWEDKREGLGELVMTILEAHVSNLRNATVGMDVLTPADLEARYGLSGGHIFHGEMTLNQQYVLRPVPGWGRYRTPIEGLYLCGSGSHPGGGITGAPGFNGARAVLKDWSRIAASA